MHRILQDEIEAQYPTMIKTLHEWCSINSGSTNLEGLHHMHQVLHKAFAPLADMIETHPAPSTSIISLEGNDKIQSYGNILFIRKRPKLQRRILLCAHMDTVFSAHHPFQQLKMLDANRLNGPGVTDMKGGILVLLHALRAFEKTQEAQSLGWDICINADEELGSPGSRVFLEKIAPQYPIGLVYEPAMTENGLFAKNRRGSGKLTLICSGRSAHAGRDFHEGKNAIVQLSKVLIDIHALNQKRKNVTINVGQIAGGRALNMVPDKAVAKLDVRITQETDEKWVREAIDKILYRHQKEGYQLKLHGQFERPVKRVNPATLRLFKRIQSIGKKLNLELEWKDSGGCCDGNNLSKAGLAVIDTLGVRGGNIHSEHEFIALDSLIERTLLNTLLFQELAKGGLEEVCKHEGEKR